MIPASKHRTSAYHIPVVTHLFRVCFALLSAICPLPSHAPNFERKLWTVRKTSESHPCDFFCSSIRTASPSITVRYPSQTPKPSEYIYQYIICIRSPSEERGRRAQIQHIGAITRCQKRRPRGRARRRPVPRLPPRLLRSRSYRAAHSPAFTGTHTSAFLRRAHTLACFGNSFIPLTQTTC